MVFYDPKNHHECVKAAVADSKAVIMAKKNVVVVG
jgi:hypothetical protein